MNNENETPQLGRVEDGVIQIGNEVLRMERGISVKTITSTKAIIIQTVALIITLIGFAIAAERRLTTIEVQSANETQIRAQADAYLLESIKKLQDKTELLSENQVRVATILDVIDKRNAVNPGK